MIAFNGDISREWYKESIRIGTSVGKIGDRVLGAFPKLVTQNSTPASNMKRVCVVLVPVGPNTNPEVVLLVPTCENSARAKKILY